MVKFEILNSEPVTISEIRDLLEKKNLDELNLRAKRTLDYTREFSKLTTDKANVLIQKLKELDILRLKDEVIVKLVEFLPEKEEEVKSIVEGMSISLTKEQISQVLKTISDNS